MTKGQERSTEFWFEFDNFFNPGFPFVTQEVSDASFAIFATGHDPWTSWTEHRAAHTYPDGFRDHMMEVQEPLLFLSAHQVAILDRHFAGDPDAERTAFEQFGQGVLFDDRRPVGDKLHKMDINGGTPVGYHVWHPFIRASVLVGADADRWLQVNRNVGLAWAIQSEARPVQDAPDNPGLPPARLEELRFAWLDLSVDQLDAEFDSFPFPASLTQRAGAARLARSGYDRYRGDLPVKGDADPSNG
jgi:hypothetical protein